MSTDTDTEVYLTARKVRRRYDDIADMTLWRWINDPRLQFPPPKYFGRRRYWKLASIEKWERARARAS